MEWSGDRSRRVDRTSEVEQCREQVVRTLALAQELSLLADPRRKCSHFACALLDRVVLEAAAELRRAAARAGLNLAGLYLAHPSEPYRVAQEPDAREVNDDVSSTPAK